jgi:hypothetical protein
VPLILGGLCLKIIASLVRYWVAAVFYGTGDFFDYDSAGRNLSIALRHGHFVTPAGRLAGTNFVRLFTGYVYAVTPRELMSGFLVYSWLSFLGLLLFWRAYRIAISQRWDVTYLKWLIILPSLLYWPSAVGKDALMLLGMGMTSYGVACLLSNRPRRGVPVISFGLLAMCMVRPHVALVVCGGLAFAVLARRYRGGFLQAIVSFAFVVAAGLLVIGAASSFFGIQTFNRASIQQEITDVSHQTGEGGSNFHPVQVNSPANFPLATVTVLYRPLPFEAHSMQEFLTSLEGLILIILSIRVLPRSVRALRYARNRPYLVYCLTAMMIFIIAFSGFSNFGLLARQRTVLEPLLIVVLSLPPRVDRELSRERVERRKVKTRANEAV